MNVSDRVRAVLCTGSSADATGDGYGSGGEFGELEACEARAEAGLSLSLAAAIGLSHNTFDAAIFLGVCDKIVPGLVIAAATFGHLPSIFLPAGPMPSGISNDEKTEVRKRFAD